ncbi:MULTISPECIES: hypothetical protein [Aneurinibacillus]|jgi:hypothetical protein|uniref:Uncharacterized protein n=1 Tax=Aneurinibacillus danicus TaxID=267746 RepID=A0A511VCR5_9BACL|nr:MULTISPECIES: hypothetical protein [Aneurinibacillus]GEN36654.1 hypothetical protein ADA01nite_41140 [Aneurinibacillus danicus]
MARESYIEIHMTEEEKETLKQFAEAIGWTFSELEMFLTKEFIRKMHNKKENSVGSNSLT